MSGSKRVQVLLLTWLVLLGSGLAWAHALGDAFIQIKPVSDGWEGRWRAPRSLFLAADTDRDGHLSRGEIEKAWTSVVGDRFTLNDGNSTGVVATLGTDLVDDGPLMIGLPIHFAKVSAQQGLYMNYRLFPPTDQQPQALAIVFSEKGQPSTLVLTPDASRKEIPLTRPDGSVSRFIKLGINHILTGWDHLLFLTCLVICGGSLWRWVKVITAFSVAHSITLALAVLGVVHVSSRIIEPTIAFSIAAAAIVGWYGLHRGRTGIPKGGWQLAFSFGLVHGLGFAGALQELNLSGWQAGLPLVGFNVGVEMGQLSVASILFPIVGYLTRKPWGVQVQKAVLIVSAIIGMGCCIERIFFYSE